MRRFSGPSHTETKGDFMIFGLSRHKKANRRIVEHIYGELTRAGRCEAFYAEHGVPDTVMGRFEMIAAQMIVFLRRTGSGSPALKDLAQEIVDAFFEDLDHSMREIGIGDMGVPKRMKKLARMFYGRYEAYAPALDAGDREGLAAALARNVHPKTEPAAMTDADRLGMLAVANRLIAAAAAFDTTSEADLLAGRIAIVQPGEPQQVAPRAE
jgi:cytochrome b pre-mRNA-processing protein 3